MNNDEFRSHIDRIDWFDIINLIDASIASELFHETFTTIADVYASYKEINVKEGAPALMNVDYLGHVDKRNTCRKHTRNHQLMKI